MHEHSRRGWGAARGQLVLLAVLVVVTVFGATVRVAESAETVTVVAIDTASSTITVRHDGTRRTSQFAIPDPVALGSFHVGQVLDGSESSAVATRGARLPRIREGTDSCYLRCMAATGATVAQCVYCCAMQ